MKEMRRNDGGTDRAGRRDRLLPHQGQGVWRHRPRDRRDVRGPDEDLARQARQGRPLSVALRDRAGADPRRGRVGAGGGARARARARAQVARSSTGRSPSRASCAPCRTRTRSCSASACARRLGSARRREPGARARGTRPQPAPPGRQPAEAWRRPRRRRRPGRVRGGTGGWRADASVDPRVRALVEHRIASIDALAGE